MFVVDRPKRHGLNLNRFGAIFGSKCLVPTPAIKNATGDGVNYVIMKLYRCKMICGKMIKIHYDTELQKRGSASGC